MGPRVESPGIARRESVTRKEKASSRYMLGCWTIAIGRSASSTQ